ncbi:MAG: GNAT family N-acetyltransferase [Desulfomonile tiedjei]|nr:GNAT family N-acetyltransferase [Desulfomonile tiedjei]
MEASHDLVEFRPYAPGDERGILDLLRICGHPRKAEFWPWINKDGPYGETVFEIAVVRGIVIAHYSVLPTFVLAGGSLERAGLAIHAAVHPEYRYAGNILEVARRVFDRCRDQGIRFVYGFPNENIWKVTLHLLHWKPITDIVALERHLEGLPTSRGRSVAVRDRVSFDERHTRVAVPAVAGEEMTSVYRTTAYLNWRYASNPQVRYVLLEAGATLDTLAGYAVLKFYEKSNVRYVHIVEFGAAGLSADVFTALVIKAAEVGRQGGAEILSCWMFENALFYRVLEEIGLKAVGFKTHFAYRPIDPTFDYELLRKERWLLQMGDSDNF